MPTYYEPEGEFFEPSENEINDWNIHNDHQNNNVDLDSNTMTFNEFLKIAMRRQGLTPNLRAGQVFMNTLYESKPELAKLIHGSHYDPFYDDKRINDFIGFIVQRWDE